MKENTQLPNAIRNAKALVKLIEARTGPTQYPTAINQLSTEILHFLLDIKQDSEPEEKSITSIVDTVEDILLCYVHEVYRRDTKEWIEIIIKRIRSEVSNEA